MAFPSDIPDIIYLNEEEVSDLLSYINKGEINEVIEKVSSKEEESSKFGLRSIIIAQFGETTTEGQEVENVKNLNAVAKLAIVQKILKDKNRLKSIKFHEQDYSREELEEGEFIEIECFLLKTPIDQLSSVLDTTQNIFQKASEASGDFGEEMGIDEKDKDQVNGLKQVFSSLTQEKNILRAKVDDIQHDFVMPYKEDKFRSKPIGFPEKGKKYKIFGRISRKYGRSDSYSLLKIIDKIPQLESHQGKFQIKKFKKQLAAAASQLSGRKVDISEFELSHPDVQIKPFAIYT